MKWAICHQLYSECHFEGDVSNHDLSTYNSKLNVKYKDLAHSNVDIVLLCLTFCTNAQVSNYKMLHGKMACVCINIAL